jgi:hypothetical protein
MESATDHVVHPLYNIRAQDATFVQKSFSGRFLHVWLLYWQRSYIAVAFVIARSGATKQSPLAQSKRCLCGR